MLQSGNKKSPWGLRVLIVDDHADTAHALAMLLQHRGYNCQWFTSAAQALDAAKLTRFELLICDIAMPDCNGLQLLRRLQRDRPIPAIAVSGHCSPEDTQKSLAAGYALHMNKPINTEELYDAIERITKPVPQEPSLVEWRPTL